MLDFHTARTPLEDVALTEITPSPDVHLGPGAPQSEWPVHILAVSGVRLAAAQARERGWLAYAWNVRKPLGRAVLFGIIPDEDIPPLGNAFAMGASVGEEPLYGGLVLVRPNRTLVSLGDIQTPEAAGYLNLESDYERPELVPDFVPRY